MGTKSGSRFVHVDLAETNRVKRKTIAMMGDEEDFLKTQVQTPQGKYAPFLPRL